MNLTRTRAALSLTALAVAVTAVFSLRAQMQSRPQPLAAQVPQPTARPQPASSTAPVRAVVFLDPAHGGPDSGASLGNNVAEKDVTLTLVEHLRPKLASVGFNVVTTRDGDLTSVLPTDQRAETANRLHPLACIVIHATASGSGIHLYTSTLPPALSANESGPSSQSDATAPFVPIPWESAQAGFIDQSRRLSDLLKATLTKIGLPVLTGSAPLRPLDNLMCPAVAIEIAPRGESGAASVSPANASYQQQVGDAISAALEAWRTQNTLRPGDTP